MDKTYAASKTTCPALLPTVLHRPALVNALNEAIARTVPTEDGPKTLYKVILLCAAAGYGKTTLLIDFAKQSALPCCWYFLEHADADEIRFLELLLFSIRRRFPRFAATLDARLAAARDPNAEKTYLLETFVESLARAINQEISERFILMLCNYHEINHSQVIATLVNRFIRSLPPQCTLVLESRAQPNLDLAPLLIQDEVFGLGSAELRFTASDIQKLARLQKGLELIPTEAAQIEQTLDGWIAGILLGTRLGDLRLAPFALAGECDSAWRAPAMRPEPRFLLAYLSGEVFAREKEAYAFLREVSILREMTPDLCNMLLSIQDAAERLAYLEQQGLFISHYNDGETTHYICQRMLRELLYEELHTHYPERFRALQLRAVELFRASQDYEQAISHALAIPVPEIAADLVEQVYEHMFAQGYSTTLAEWIDALPTEIISQRPRLLLARANIFLTTGEYSQALPLLDATENVLQSEADDLPDVQNLRTELLIARATLLFQCCDYQRAREMSWQVLDMLPAAATTLRVEAYLRLGVCECMLCDFASGIAAFRQALHAQRAGKETRQLAKLHTALANAYDMVGQHTLSEHHRVRALQCWERLDEIWGKVDSFVGLGLTKRLQEQYGEAERFLRDAIDMAQGSVHYVQGEAYALVNLGETYLDQGYYQQALLALEDGLALASKVADDYLTNCVLCDLAEIYLLMGDGQTPLLLLAQVGQSSSLYEQKHTYVFMLYELTRTMILLRQEHYEEAYDCLVKLEQSFQTSGLKRELLQVTVGLAACLRAQGKIPAMTEKVKKAVELAGQNGYKHVCLAALGRCSDLLRTIHTVPETEHIYTLLQGDARIVQVPSDAPAMSLVSVHPTAEVPRSPALYTREATPSLRILALGEPEVYLNGALVKRWRMSQTIEVFFFLLNAGKPVHKEQISVALWPDTDNQTDQALRSCIYYLRKLLGPPCILSQRGTYELKLSTVFGKNVWYDVQRFRDNYHTAKNALEAKDDAVARIAFQEMTLLYRGDYVSSFYSDWCTASRSELKYAYIDAYYQLALIAWRNQQFDESISHWHHLLAIDACLEEAHLGLMQCYLQQGKRGLALRQYQICVEVLNEELAVTPGPAIQNLYRSLLADS